MATLKRVAGFGLPVALAICIQLPYNDARFGSLWDYGDTYLPTAVEDFQPFSVRYVAENIGHYFLAPIQFSADFPWLSHRGWQPLVNTTRAESMSSLFLLPPFLLLAALCWPIVKNRSEGANPKLRAFVFTAAGSSFLMCLVMLSFGASSRRYMQDFVPIWMILAVIGVASFTENRAMAKRYVIPTRAVLGLTFLLHAHLVFTESFDWDPPDHNVMRTFVALGPSVRTILPGRRLDREEGIIRNDLATLALKTGQYDQAVDHLEKADELMPNEPRIQKNLELAKAWLQRQRTQRSR